MANIAIIGTAGRKEDADKLSGFMFTRMVSAVLDVLTRDNHTLISGGAAWSDHISVKLLLDGFATKLRLHLPCEFDLDEAKFVDTGEFNPDINPGGTSNYYHRLFSAKRGKNSLEEIAIAIDRGAEIKCGGGFFNRNTAIANEADGVIALTFGNQRFIKDGGTADTCRKYLQRGGKYLVHIDLNVLAKGGKAADAIFRDGSV